MADPLNSLAKEVLEIRDRNPQLSMDNAFVAWFLRAFITDDEESAVEALKGGPKDKGVDAIYVDHESSTVYVLQGKYRQVSKLVMEKRSDVIALGDLGRCLLVQDRKSFESLQNEADIVVKDLLEKARKAVHKRKYRLCLQFVTTGKVSKTHQLEAEQRIIDWENAFFQTFSRNDLLKLMQDYIEGASPPVPQISLQIHAEKLFNRVDKDLNIQSWVFSMLGQDLGKLYREVGDRLFARNIRGYQGKSEVNRSIAGTIADEPEYFWYFNNGVTIIADEAKQISDSGNTHLRVTNAQIINGQQTVRTLAEGANPKVSLLVRVIDVPRESEVGHDRYNYLVDQIVKATNWQNSISQIDLKSNDVEQVRIEREFRKIGYQYLRKKQTRSEARRISGDRFRHIVKKDDLAQHVGACILDPYQVRLGKKNLFKDDEKNDNYRRIFDHRSAAEYLVFYWLHQEVARYSRGISSRGYAKWLVLNFVWSQIGHHLRQHYLRENLRYVSERPNRYFKTLNCFGGAVDSIFNVAMAFYRANKRTSEGKLLDESNFFKREGLHKRFLKFWNSPKNSRRKKVSERLARFIKNLRETER